MPESAKQTLSLHRPHATCWSLLASYEKALPAVICVKFYWYIQWDRKSIALAFTSCYFKKFTWARL